MQPIKPRDQHLRDHLEPGLEILSAAMLNVGVFVGGNRHYRQWSAAKDCVPALKSLELGIAEHRSLEHAAQPR